MVEIEEEESRRGVGVRYRKAWVVRKGLRQIVGRRVAVAGGIAPKCSVGMYRIEWNEHAQHMANADWMYHL